MSKKPYTHLKKRAQVEAVMSPDGGPAIIDFWAAWCGPCKALAPHFEAIAQERAEAGSPVKFYKIDTEHYPKLAEAFHVRSIPTMTFIHNGEILDVSVGAMDSVRLAKKVQWLEDKAAGKGGFFSRLFGGGKKSESAA